MVSKNIFREGYASEILSLHPINSKSRGLKTFRDLKSNWVDSPIRFKKGNMDSMVPKGVWVTGAPVCWHRGFTGQGCKVGVIDSGIDSSHPDIKNIGMRRCLIGDENYKKLHYHGTHISGIIGANGKIRGVAPNAILHDYRVFDQMGLTKASIVENAIRYAADDGCDVINLSLGGDIDNEYLKSSVRYALKKGCLLVAAAGNEGDKVGWEEDSYSFPATYGSVLAVASVNYLFESGKITIEETQFSNRNCNIDMCACGYKVVSTMPDKRYGFNSGTSMACSHASGFAALLYSKFRVKFPDYSKSKIPLFNLMKLSTLPVTKANLTDSKCTDELILNLRKVAGDGLVTAFPILPIKRDGLDSFFELPNE